MTQDFFPENGTAQTEPFLQQEALGLLWNAPIGICISTPEGRYLSVNPALARMCGYDSPQEMIASITDVARVYADPVDREELLRLLESQGQVVDYECLLVRRDGSRFWTSQNVHAVRDLAGGTVRLQKFIMDISRQKQEECHRRLAIEILGILNNPLILFDAIDHILVAIKRETGVEAAGIRLRSGDDFLYFVQNGFSEEFVRTENTLAVRDTRGDVCRDENGRVFLECTCGLVLSGQTDPANPLFTLNGSFWINDSSLLLDLPASQDPRLHPRNTCIHEGFRSVALIPVRAGQEIIGLLQLNDRKKGFFTLDMIHFFEGIGASIGMALMRKEGNMALRQAEQHYRALFENAPALYVITHDRGGEPVIVDCNELLLNTLGYTRAEVLERPLTDLYTPASRCKLLGGGYQRALDGGFVGEERQLLARDGRIVETLLRATPETDAQGTVVGTLAMYVDITERKQMEKEREKLQARLHHAQKMEAVGTLAGGVAHDFNNLLQVIGGRVQLLLARKLKTDPDAGVLEQIRKSGERAAGLVRQLLTFSRKVEGQCRPVDMNQEALEAQKILGQTLPRMVHIELALDNALWPVSADPAQMQQIFLNLGSNAADAMPKGGRLLFETNNVTLDAADCRDHPGAVPGDYVLLTVSDTGCGMSEEVLGKIFDPFFTTKDAGKGTGLGLASVYGIVKSHGGLINCYSEVGRGTSFKIHLPILKQDAVPLDGEPQKAVPEGGTETILVVDDELEIRALTQEALEFFGYVVMCAASGEEALEMYKERGQDFDLILLDLNMPGMGGHSCLLKLREHNSLVKVLIASGYSAHLHAKDVVSSGAAGFIGKPYQMKDLAGKVREILNDKKVGP